MITTTAMKKRIRDLLKEQITKSIKEDPRINRNQKTRVLTRRIVRIRAEKVPVKIDVEQRRKEALENARLAMTAAKRFHDTIKELITKNVATRELTKKVNLVKKIELEQKERDFLTLRKLRFKNLKIRELAAKDKILREGLKLRVTEEMEKTLLRMEADAVKKGRKAKEEFDALIARTTMFDLDKIISAAELEHKEEDKEIHEKAAKKEVIEARKKGEEEEVEVLEEEEVEEVEEEQEEEEEEEEQERQEIREEASDLLKKEAKNPNSLLNIKFKGITAKIRKANKGLATVISIFNKIVTKGELLEDLTGTERSAFSRIKKDLPKIVGLIEQSERINELKEINRKTPKKLKNPEKVFLLRAKKWELMKIFQDVLENEALFA